MNTLLALLALAAPARATVEDVTLCFFIMTDFTDKAGYYWSTNGQRPARGVFFETHPITTPPWYWTQRQAEEDGCVVVPLDTDYSYAVRMQTRAEIGGITIESYTDVTDYDTAYESDTSNLFWEYVYFTLDAHDTSQSFFVNTTASHHATWANLAIGMWAMYRNTMHLGTGSANRLCCEPRTYADGTCDEEDAGVDFYPLDLLEIDDYDPDTVVLVNQLDTKAGESSCCGSWWPANGFPDKFPAVVVNEPLKYAVAHELGHVVVEMRIGKRTKTGAKAPLRDCMGSYNTNEWYLFDPNDPDQQEDLEGEEMKSELTREWHSMAAREGWAYFYASWLFNDQQSDCAYQTWIVHDFDLDGDIDDNWVSAISPPNADTGNLDEDHTYDGSIDCEGVGAADYGGLQRNESLNPALDARDWLEDVFNAGLCGPESEDTGYDVFLVGAGTAYDWHRYFWDMFTDEAVPVETLADLYVDACPTNWIPDKTIGVDPDRWPITRFEASADANDILDHHEEQNDNGQDH